MVAAEDACERGWERQLRAGECLGEGGAGFEDSPQIWVDVPLRIVQTYELVCDFGDFLLSCDTKVVVRIVCAGGSSPSSLCSPEVSPPSPLEVSSPSALETSHSEGSGS